MTSNNDAHIEAIRAKAEGLGGKCYPCPSGHEVINFGGEDDDNFSISYSHKGRGLSTAESLLAALSPGPVVEIVHATIDSQSFGGKVTICGKCRLGKGGSCEYRAGATPSDRCPGPAPDGYEWRLCLLPKEGE